MIRRRLKVTGPKIDYSVLAIKKGPSIQLDKGWKRAAFETALTKAYAFVDVRDDNRSRVTGKSLLPQSSNDKVQREHNHLGPRSTYPSLKTAVKNIFLVSTYEHGFITRNELRIHGRDANKGLRFSWNRNVIKPGKEPFRIPAAFRFDEGKAAA